MRSGKGQSLGGWGPTFGSVAVPETAQNGPATYSALREPREVHDRGPEFFRRHPVHGKPDGRLDRRSDRQLLATARYMRHWLSATRHHPSTVIGCRGGGQSKSTLCHVPRHRLTQSSTCVFRSGTAVHGSPPRSVAPRGGSVQELNHIGNAKRVGRTDRRKAGRALAVAT